MEHSASRLRLLVRTLNVDLGSASYGTLTWDKLLILPEPLIPLSVHPGGPGGNKSGAFLSYGLSPKEQTSDVSQWSRKLLGTEARTVAR